MVVVLGSTEMRSSFLMIVERDENACSRLATAGSHVSAGEAKRAAGDVRTRGLLVPLS